MLQKLIESLAEVLDVNLQELQELTPEQQLAILEDMQAQEVANM